MQFLVPRIELDPLHQHAHLNDLSTLDAVHRETPDLGWPARHVDTGRQFVEYDELTEAQGWLALPGRPERG